MAKRRAVPCSWLISLEATYRLLFTGVEDTYPRPLLLYIYATLLPDHPMLEFCQLSHVPSYFRKEERCELLSSQEKMQKQLPKTSARFL